MTKVDTCLVSPRLVVLIEPSFCSDIMTIPYKWFFSKITMQCMLPKGTHIYLQLYKKVTGRQKTHLHLWTLVCVSLSHWPKGGIVQQFFLCNSGIEKILKTEYFCNSTGGKTWSELIWEYVWCLFISLSVFSYI